MKDILGSQTLESMSQAVWYNRWTLNKFKKYLKGDILEVGCGIGNFTKSLVNYGQVWAVDIDKTYIKDTWGVTEGKVKVGFGNIETGEYFFDSKHFDSIVCLNVLEHIEKDDQALKNLYNLLKNNGYLILLVPAHPFLLGEIDKSIGHFRRYIKEKLIKKLESFGFKILNCRKLNFLGAIGWYIAGKILLENKVDEDKIKMFNFVAPLVLPLEDIIEPFIGTSILVVAQKIL